MNTDASNNHDPLNNDGRLDDRDPATTAVLEQLIIPDHGADFWHDLEASLAEVDQGPTVGTVVDITERRFSRAAQRNLLVAAAAVMALLAGAALFAARSGVSQVETVDDELPAPEAPQLEHDNTSSTARGEASEWFYSDRTIWDGSRFVAASRNDSHWVSPDGIDWTRESGLGYGIVIPWECPVGYACEVTPAAADIPFHWSGADYQVAARAGNTILLNAYVRYDIDQQSIDPPDPSSDVSLPGPVLTPELLSAAADSDPCFADIQANGPGLDGESAHIASWEWGGTGDPTVVLRCTRNGEPAAIFQFDLHGHLTDAELQRVYSSGVASELWVEQPGSPARRVADPPVRTRWVDDETPGGSLEGTTDVVSSGDRFWALDDEGLMTSVDGLSWTLVEGPDTELFLSELAAAPGGHLALWLSEDEQFWDETAWLVVSHDNGATWSAPVEANRNYGTSVGPLGAAVVTTSEAGRTLTLYDEGEVRFTTTSTEGDCCFTVTVGEDRVLLQSDRHAYLYGPDGTLLHDTVWSDDVRFWEHGTTEERVVTIGFIGFIGIVACMILLLGSSLRRRAV